MDLPYAWNPPTDEFSSYKLPKRAVLRELITFLSKVYRLIYVAMLVFVFRPFATAIGITLMLFAILSYPAGNRQTNLDQPADSN